MADLPDAGVDALIQLGQTLDRAGDVDDLKRFGVEMGFGVTVAEILEHRA